MRNIKKLLALVLVLVMAMSFASAAYADADSITYTEAVDVMSAVGIFNGIDGEFQPNGNLTREQAMKIVAYMLLGQKTADALPKDIQPFEDVQSGRWSAGAIAYCASYGIVSGDGTGNFNPTADVTGYEFGKMVMGAAGIKGEFTGANWKFNVALALADHGMLENLDGVILSQPLTREQAAQMAFNALIYTANAGTTGKWVVTCAQSVEANLKKALASVKFDSYFEAYTAVKAHNLADADYEITPETNIANSLADKKHDVTEWADTSVFGVDSWGWSSKIPDAKGNVTVYHCVTEEPVSKFSDTTKTVADLYKALGLKETTEATYWVDGVKGTLSLTKDGKTTVGGNGADVEIYVDATGAIKIIEVQTYLATVTKFEKAVAATATTEAIPAKATIACAALANGSEVVETERYEEDDVLLITVANGKVVSHDFAEVVVDTLYEVNSVKGTITLKAAGTYAYVGNIATFVKNYADVCSYYTDGVNVYGYGAYVPGTVETEVDGWAQLIQWKVTYTGTTGSADAFGDTTVAATAKVQAQIRHLNGEVEIVDVAVASYDGKGTHAAGFYYTNPATMLEEEITAEDNGVHTSGAWVCYYLTEAGYDFCAVEGATVLTAETIAKGTVKLSNGYMLTSKTAYTEYNVNAKAAQYETALNGYKNIVTNGAANLLVFTAPKSTVVTEMYGIVDVAKSTDTSVKLDDYAYALVATGVSNATSTQWTFAVNGEAVNYFVANDQLTKFAAGSVCVLTIDKGVVTVVAEETKIDLTAASKVVYVDESYISTEAAVHTLAAEYVVFNAETGAVDSVEVGDSIVVAKTNDKSEVVMIFVVKAEA